MKKSMLLLAVLTMLTAGSIYAKQGHGPDQDGTMGKPGMHHMGPGPDIQGDRHMLVKMAGLESIVDKYKIQIQRVMLNSKEANLKNLEMKRNLHKEMGEVIKNYDSNPDKYGAEITRILKSLRDVEAKMGENRQNAMDQIQKLHEQEKKEISKGVDTWINTLSRNPAEMKKFVDHIQKMQAQRMDKGPKGTK